MLSSLEQALGVLLFLVILLDVFLTVLTPALAPASSAGGLRVGRGCSSGGKSLHIRAVLCDTEAQDF